MTVREQLLERIQPYRLVVFAGNLLFLIGMVGAGIFQSSFPTLLFAPCILVGLVIGVGTIITRNHRVRCPRCGSAIQEWFSFTNELHAFTVATSSEPCRACKLSLSDTTPNPTSRIREFQQPAEELQNDRGHFEP